jgi:hypothetical protein
MEFVTMERLWADASGQDSYDPYTCAVKNALFIECLDIAGARTLGNSLSDTVAYNMSGSSGDLNKNFYAVLGLEGLLNMTGNVTTHFGGDVDCNGKNVGDGAVNAFDIAAIMWYQFKFEPYDQLPNDPSTVVTVQGRDDTGYRCNVGESRRMWQMAIGDDYCHNGQNADLLGYDKARRRLGHDTVDTRLQPFGVPVSRATTVDMRSPYERRESINVEDMARDANAMRALDVDVNEWGVVQGHGRWIRIRSPGVQVAMELYVSGLSVDYPLHMSLQSVPSKNCTQCIPIDEDPRNVVVAFARRSEYSEEYARSVVTNDHSICASIVPAVIQSSVMLGNTIAIRQQPPNKACAFDIFLWVPEFPLEGIHVSKHASPYSFSARRLAAVGAESALAHANDGCEGDIGVLAGSAAMDGFRGQVQRGSSCARYGFTQSTMIHPIVMPDLPQEQCPSIECNPNAPRRSEVVSRSFQALSSSGLENAFTASLHKLAMTSLTPHTKFFEFEAMLAREAQSNDCCSGYVCLAEGATNVSSGSCVSELEISPPPPAPSPPPPNPPSPLAPSPAPRPSSPPVFNMVVFDITVEASLETFNVTDYKVKVAAIAGVMLSQVEVVAVPGSIVLYTTINHLTGDSQASALDRVKTQIVPNATFASAVLGIQVSEVTPPRLVAMDPSPTPVVVHKSTNSGVIVMLILFSVAFAVCIVSLLVSMYMNKTEKADPSQTQRLIGGGKVVEATRVIPSANASAQAQKVALMFKMEGGKGRMRTY